LRKGSKISQHLNAPTQHHRGGLDGSKFCNEGVTTARPYCTLAGVNTSESDGPPRPTADVDERAQPGEELAALIDLLPDGLMAFDLKGRCFLISEGACQIVSRRRDEWMGKTLSEVAPEALGSTFDRAFLRCQAERVTTALGQTYYPPRDRWYQSIFRPSPGGGVLLQFRSVTFEAEPGRAGRVIPLDLEPTDLTAICRAVIAEAKTDSADRRLVFTSDGDTRGAWDRLWLAQVVASLLGHAIEQSLPGTDVEIAAREAAVNEVALEVRYVGSPMTEGRIHSFFDPSPAVEPKAPGARTGSRGLGLCLSRRIIEAHGGSIRAESHAGSGITLAVSLPRTGVTEITGAPVPVSI
jgi:nitrogen fixation/metabolism regulation signal transduction histidine kinase